MSRTMTGNEDARMGSNRHGSCDGEFYVGSSGFLSITCPRVLVCICNKCYNFFHNNQVSVNWLYCEPVSRAKSGWGTLWFLLRFSRFLECMHSGWAVETLMIMWCVFVCSLFSAVACQEKRYWACPFIRQACISNYLQIKTVAFAPYIFPIKGVGFRVGLFFSTFTLFLWDLLPTVFPLHQTFSWRAQDSDFCPQANKAD